MAIDSNALALLCLKAFNVMSPEAWAAPDGKWLTPSQGDFSRAFQKHNFHDFFLTLLILAGHMSVLKLRCSNILISFYMQGLQTGFKVPFDVSFSISQL